MFTGRQIPHIVSRYGSNINPAASTPSTRELGNRLAQLLEVSLNATSLNTYRRPWQILQQFKKDKLQLQTPLFPVSTRTLALFIAFLAEQNMHPLQLQATYQHLVIPID